MKIISKKWNNIGSIHKEKTKINTTFLSLINTQYEKIGLNLIDLELEKYQNKVNTLKRNKKDITNERKTLNTEIELINQNIYQYENNISFLGKNKNTEPLVKQVLKKIEILNQKIETIKKKLTILNKG